MKKSIILVCFIFLIGAVPFVASADTTCATKYPIVLSHGMGYTDSGKLGIGYWYNIPSTLTGHGARVFLSNQTAMASTADRAAQLKTYVNQVLATTGAAKVNIIGHSQGGLDARWMITNLGMASKVASLTTVATPHRGSSVADVLLGIDSDVGGWLSGLVTEVYLWMFGGQQNAKAAAQWLSMKFMNNTFNPGTPNMSGVYYQSWSSTIWVPIILDKLLFTVSYAIINWYEGNNDGLVSVTSSKWGTYRGNQGGSIFGGGVSHVNTCDQFLDFTPFFNAPGFYVSMASDLKGKGY
jgi:triacylglycerol lipase